MFYLTDIGVEAFGSAVENSLHTERYEASLAATMRGRTRLILMVHVNPS
jgi:hypothetical protein